MRNARVVLLAATAVVALLSSVPARAIHWPFIGKAAHKPPRTAPANVRVWITSGF